MAFTAFPERILQELREVYLVLHQLQRFAAFNRCADLASSWRVSQAASRLLHLLSKPLEVQSRNRRLRCFTVVAFAQSQHATN